MTIRVLVDGVKMTDIQNSEQDTAEQEEVPFDSVIDISALEPLAAALDRDQISTIVSTCLEDATQRVKAIVEALKNDDLELIVSHAHDIKSTAGQIGAVGMQNLALQLEQLCKQGGGDEVSGLTSSLQSESDKVTAALTKEQIQSLLDRLLAA